ncbi:MAG: universal stress protein [Candidatus Omnitrophica bacterium]|nr:universal stress protein [Candidatus Omnitrophota bacterium]MCM8828651.1 universal stress protein [Candidatus Omnitrophota bacterium]
MFKKILYPIKFEDFSLDLLSCILNLKKVGTEEIILLNVIDVAKLLMDKYEGYHPENVKTLTEMAKIKIAEAINRIEQAGLKAKQRIEVGIPYREILRVANEESVELIVSGRQKKSALGEIFIGSNTDKVIRYGKLPVYIPKYPAVYGGDEAACKKYCSNPFFRILYPTDWSEYALAALQYIKGLKNAGVEEVIVAHIMDEKAMGLQTLEKFKEFEKIDIEKLEKVKQDLEAEGFNVKTHLRVGKPRYDLIKVAREEDVTLIVMAAHGKGYVKGILWGSVSRNVIEYSDRSVLLVRG